MVVPPSSPEKDSEVDSVMAGAQRTISRDSREREKEFEYMFSFPFYRWKTEAGRDQFSLF